VTQPFWETGLILRTLAGSRAHGLAREGSDTDTRGVCIPPAEVLLGLDPFEQHVSEGGDHVTYALAKFVRLALSGNPNLLETLYCDRQDVLHVDDAGERLLAERDAFLSREVGRRFMGYALDQLQRMQRHHRWLSDPPGDPDPATFGGRNDDGKVVFPSRAQERGFQAALKQWNHYRTWRRERNPERASLEEHHGYDTKHAMHLMRLLQMGEEVLTLGRVVVRRPDADWLWGIRDGALGYQELLSQARSRLERLEALVTSSQLPDQPDRACIERLLVELQLESLRG
jgi:predicted nucleotidyltransferase